MASTKCCDAVTKSWSVVEPEKVVMAVDAHVTPPSAVRYSTTLDPDGSLATLVSQPCSASAKSIVPMSHR